MNREEFECKNCYGKGYGTEFKGIAGSDDFGGEGFEIAPKIIIELCNCNRGADLKRYFTIKKKFKLL